MQSIIAVNDVVLEYAKNEKVRKETKAMISTLWQQLLSDSRKVEACIQNVSSGLLRDTVIEDQGARRISQNLCVSANKAKEILQASELLALEEK